MIAMPFINIHGQSLETRLIEGRTDTATLVFLHEGLGSVSAWAQRGLDWPASLCRATGRAGVVYSRHGYGLSYPAPSGRNVLAANYMHAQAWAVLPELLAQLGVANPILIGHSDGATIALLYASRYPTSACVTMAPHVVVEPIALHAIAQATVAFESGELRSKLAKYHADVEGAFWQWNDVWLSAGFRSFDIRADCRNITAPLLLIQGEDDAYGTMAQLDEIALAAPHAQQLRLANCGHSPHRDQAQMTLAAIASFLQAEVKD